MPNVIPEPRTEFLSETTARLLDMLPPFEQDSVDIQAALDALAMELDRFEARVETVHNAFFPQRATEYLEIMEWLLGLPTAPNDKTLEERRTTILTFMRGWKSSGSGLDWQDQMRGLIGSGWSYEEHIPGDLGTPPAGVLRIAIPYTDEIAVPENLTATVAASGTLPNGTYNYVVTAANFYGETPASNDDDAVVSGGNRTVELDWDDVAGATSYRVYRYDANIDRFRLLATVEDSEYTDDNSDTLGSDGPPMTNTTQSFRAYEARLLARRITPAHLELEFVFEGAFIVGVDQVGIDTL